MILTETLQLLSQFLPSKWIYCSTAIPHMHMMIGEHSATTFQYQYNNLQLFQRVKPGKCSDAYDFREQYTPFTPCF